MAKVLVRIPTFELEFEGAAESEDDVFNNDSFVDQIQSRAVDRAVVIVATYDNPEPNENDGPEDEGEN